MNFLTILFILSFSKTINGLHFLARSYPVAGVFASALPEAIEAGMYMKFFSHYDLYSTN
jgi:hypothetical protein